MRGQKQPRVSLSGRSSCRSAGRTWSAAWRGRRGCGELTLQGGSLNPQTCVLFAISTTRVHAFFSKG